MNKVKPSKTRTLILSGLLLLLLGPLWFWNSRVARIPTGLWLQLLPGKIILGRPLHNFEGAWFDGGSGQYELSKIVAMTIDLRSGQRTVGDQPKVIVQNSQRFTFEEVPRMNGYLVRIEDLKGDKPTRELRVNMYGRPLLVGARYLVWSHDRYFSVVDLSNDEDKLKVIETESLYGKFGVPLRAVPGADCFYTLSRPTITGTQLQLFKIEAGQVKSLNQWEIHGREVGFSGREILTHSTDLTILFHSADDGNLVREVPSPFDLLTENRLFGRLLIVPGAKACFDLKTQREISLPFKTYGPHAMNEAVAVFVSPHREHPCRIWAYDFETGRERFHLQLPSPVSHASIDDNHIVAAGFAHGLTVVTIDLADGRIVKTLEPFGMTSRSAVWLVLCFALWCVAWLRLQPTGQVWMELAFVLFLILLGLRPYDAHAQTMTLILVSSGFALWQACLTPGALIIGISRALFIGVVGLSLLPEGRLREIYPGLLATWLIMVLVLQVCLPRWLGFRVLDERRPDSAKYKMSILHLICLMTVSAVAIVTWRDANWSFIFVLVSVYFLMAVALNGCLLGLTCWIGFLRRRRLASGWVDAGLAVLLLILIIVPRLFRLWNGFSLFDWLDLKIWTTWIDMMAQNSRDPLEIFWESTAICIAVPYLLAVTLRVGGYSLQKPASSPISLKLDAAASNGTSP